MNILQKTSLKIKNAAGPITPKPNGTCRHAHDHVHLPYTCTCGIYIKHIHIPYIYHMHIPNTYTIYSYHVHVPCTKYMYHVHVPCMYHVHIPYTSNMRNNTCWIYLATSNMNASRSCFRQSWSSKMMINQCFH